MINHKLPAPLIQHYEWQEKAKCREVDPELFYLPYGLRQNNKQKRINEAKAVCKQCPVISECLQFALSTEEPFGVWGGTSPEDRKRILLRKKAAK